MKSLESIKQNLLSVWRRIHKEPDKANEIKALLNYLIIDGYQWVIRNAREELDYYNGYVLSYIQEFDESNDV